MMDGERGTGSRSRDFHLDTAVIGIRGTPRRIVGQEILSTEFIADFLESFIKLRHRGGIKIFASGVFGDLDEGMFATEVASGAGFNGNNDDAVNDDFGLLGSAHGLLVVDAAGGIATIGDNDHHLSPLASLDRLRTEVD